MRCGHLGLWCVLHVLWVLRSVVCIVRRVLCLLRVLFVSGVGWSVVYICVVGDVGAWGVVCVVRMRCACAVCATCVVCGVCVVALTPLPSRFFASATKKCFRILLFDPFRLSVV